MTSLGGRSPGGHNSRLNNIDDVHFSQQFSVMSTQQHQHRHHQAAASAWTTGDHELDEALTKSALPSSWAIEMEDLRVENVRLRLRMVYLDELFAQRKTDAELVQELAAIRVALRETTNARDRALARCKELADDSARKDDRIGSLEREIARLKVEVEHGAEMEAEMRELQTMLEGYRSLQHQASTLQADLNIVKRQYSDAQRALEESRQTCETLNRKLAEADHNAVQRDQEMNERFRSVAASQSQLERELRALDDERRQLKHDHDALQDEHRELVMGNDKLRILYDELQAGQQTIHRWASDDWAAQLDAAFPAPPQASSSSLLESLGKPPNDLSRLRLWLSRCLEVAAYRASVSKSLSQASREAIEGSINGAMRSLMDRTASSALSRLSRFSQRLQGCDAALSRIKRVVANQKTSMQREATAALNESKRLARRCNDLELAAYRETVTSLQKLFDSACTETRKAVQMISADTMGELHTRILRSNVINDDFVASIRTTITRTQSIAQGILDAVASVRSHSSSFSAGAGSRSTQRGDDPRDALIPPSYSGLEESSPSTLTVQITSLRDRLDQAITNGTNILTLLDNNLKQTAEVVATLESILENFRNGVATSLSNFDRKAKSLLDASIERLALQVQIPEARGGSDVSNVDQLASGITLTHASPIPGGSRLTRAGNGLLQDRAFGEHLVSFRNSPVARPATGAGASLDVYQPGTAIDLSRVSPRSAGWLTASFE